MKAMIAALMLVSALVSTAYADEHLLGYVRGAEALPKGSWEFYQIVTTRDDKGKGSYHAVDTSTEVEYGVTDRFSISAALLGMSLNTNGLVVDGYLPQDKSFGLKPVGFELYSKYNFMSPAKDDFGISMVWSVYKMWVDPHSGQGKDTYRFENYLLLQKYFLEGQLIWVGNFAIEATHATRKEVPGIDPDVEWVTTPEMEIETKIGTGLSYRFIPKWFIGGEALYETEYETEVGRERYSLFAGPSLHYGSQAWWATATWFQQLDGGGGKYDGQTEDLHLIEKTKTEARLKVGYNF